MKKLLIIFFIVTASFAAKALPHAPITDTLQWLKVNIEQKNSYYSGKPLSVLLDTLSLYGLRSGIQEYTAPIFSDGAPAGTTPKDTVYTNHFTLFLGEVFGGGPTEKSHETAFWNSFRNKTPNTINTHIKYLKFTFVKKLSLPTSTTKDVHISNIFSPIEGIARPYILQSVSVGEY